jgi:putative transposase
VSCYRLIDAEKASYPISVLCRVLKVSRSGYYDWTTIGRTASALKEGAGKCGPHGKDTAGPR